MPLYEFRCKTCEETFEVRRPMSQAGDPAVCTAGHPAVRLLSVFASVGGGATPTAAPAPAARPMGGGCGGACACH